MRPVLPIGILVSILPIITGTKVKAGTAIQKPHLAEKYATRLCLGEHTKPQQPPHLDPLNQILSPHTRCGLKFAPTKYDLPSGHFTDGVIPYGINRAFGETH